MSAIWHFRHNCYSEAEVKKAILYITVLSQNQNWSSSFQKIILALEVAAKIEYTSDPLCF